MKAPVFPSLVDICDDIGISSIVILLAVAIETVVATFCKCT